MNRADFLSNRGASHSWSAAGRLATVSVAMVALIVSANALGATPVQAQAQVRVEQLRTEPDAHRNQIRTVVGVVDRLVSQPGTDEPAYYLEDDYGLRILVVPYDDPPERGARVTVTGVVSLDGAGDPVISTFDPTAVGTTENGAPAGSGSAAGAGGEMSGMGGQGAGGEMAGELPIGGIVVAVVGFLLFSVALLVFLRRSAVEEPSPVGAPAPTAPGDDEDEPEFPVAALWPQSERAFDGRTLRYLRPDPTLMLLPAKLEVVGGPDSGEVIRFSALDGEPASIMFGRAPGSEPTNVQLKQKTVSRTHAVVRNREGVWFIENLSLTNPTVLNGDVLGVKEARLSDGDRIEMGEVTFRFKES